MPTSFPNNGDGPRFWNVCLDPKRTSRSVIDRVTKQPRPHLLSPLMAVALLSSCAHLPTDDPQPQPEAGHNCVTIAGEFSFQGALETDGKTAPITFLQRQIRPSRQGVQWIRISAGAQEGDFRVALLNASGDAVGDDLLIHARCVAAAWQEHQSVAGNSDGTWVNSDRTWRYWLDPGSALVVELNEASVSRYFPGINSRPRSGGNVARFLPR